MLKRPGRQTLSLIIAVYAYAWTISLSFVICVEDDGAAGLESMADHCCIAGVPQHGGSGGPERCVATDPPPAGGHSCAGCVDVPVVGHAVRVAAPVLSRLLSAAPTPALLPIPRMERWSGSHDVSHESSGRLALDAFDQLVLNC
jgi:hypothetical protein